jgi:hypothetical protein
MKPENLVLKGGAHVFRIDAFLDYITKKPTARITCIDDMGTGSHTNDEGEDEWDEELSEGRFYINKENIDIIISKLQEIKNYLNQ